MHFLFAQKSSCGMPPFQDEGPERIQKAPRRLPPAAADSKGHLTVSL